MTSTPLLCLSVYSLQISEGYIWSCGPETRDTTLPTLCFLRLVPVTYVYDLIYDVFPKFYVVRTLLGVDLMFDIVYID